MYRNREMWFFRNVKALSTLPYSTVDSNSQWSTNINDQYKTDFTRKTTSLQKTIDQSRPVRQRNNERKWRQLILVWGIFTRTSNSHDDKGKYLSLAIATYRDSRTSHPPNYRYGTSTKRCRIHLATKDNSVDVTLFMRTRYLSSRKMCNNNNLFAYRPMARYKDWSRKICIALRIRMHDVIKHFLVFTVANLQYVGYLLLEIAQSVQILPTFWNAW